MASHEQNVTDPANSPLPENVGGRRRKKGAFIRFYDEESIRWKAIVKKSGLTEQELGRRRLLGLREPVPSNSQAVHIVAQAAQQLEELATAAHAIAQVVPVKSLVDRVTTIRKLLRDAIEALG